MPVHGYVINPKCGIAALGERLGQTLGLSTGGSHTFRRVYLDSFDWRLLHKGYWLQAEHQDGAVLLQLFRLRDGRLASQSHAARLPRFAEDLAASRLTTLLKPIIDVRALLPQLSVTVTQLRLQRLDTQDKLTAELQLEQITSDSIRRPLQLLLHMPVRGYDRDNHVITRTLTQAQELQPSTDAPLRLLLDRLGIDTCSDRKPAIRLDPAARSDAQIKALLAFFLGVMRRNEAGIVDDLDSEFLHDFRIAIRRSRSLLGQVPGIMPQRTLARAQQQLARLGRLTTPLRDLDVMLLTFDDYRGLLPERRRADLDPALVFIRQQRQAAYHTVRQHLRTRSHAGFCDWWQRYLQQPAPANTRLPNARRPLRQLADERIWKNCRKVLKQGKAITPQSAPEELHTLRKSCKKLRYLIEFFGSLYPKKKIKEVIATLKQLQDNLGEYQDIHVHMDFFRQLSDTMRQQGQPAATTQALDKIVAALDIQQQDSRRQFQARFGEFSSAAHQQLFERLFNA